MNRKQRVKSLMALYEQTGNSLEDFIEAIADTLEAYYEEVVRLRAALKDSGRSACDCGSTGAHMKDCASMRMQAPLREPRRRCDHMVDPRSKFCSDCWRLANPPAQAPARSACDCGSPGAHMSGCPKSVRPARSAEQRTVTCKDCGKAVWHECK